MPPINPIAPNPQYVPANFALGSMEGLNSNIPRICGYQLPLTHSEAQMFTDGYFGPEQRRPDVAVPAVSTGGADYTAGSYVINQGQPSLGALLPFGSLVFWSRGGPTPLQGFAHRSPDVDGYGLKPGEKEVKFTGNSF